jgi:(1->4)-alpha-D-glucan 1-alpha-D-glucosylmutase
MTREAEHGAAMAGAPGPRVPLATYRLQFNRHFTFEDAARLVPYLRALGISDLYASSYLAARPGSLHGYDIVDHGRLNPEIGTPEAYDRLVAALRACGMGQILDVVPNHVGIAEGANRWWNDVLEHGLSSPYAERFDVDWQPVERHLAGKVLLPILGDQYGRVLENQELTIEIDAGAFRIRYHGTRLPVEPASATMILSHGLPLLAEALGADSPLLQEYESIITALGNLPGVTETSPERARQRLRETHVAHRRLSALVASDDAVRACLDETLRAFNGKSGDPRSFDLLDRLLAEQPYRLAHWRVAGEEINYRRFFDVNELAAIRMENMAVFRDTHRLILELVDAGAVTGLRIDHPDGLYDPRRYFLALQRERAEQLARRRQVSGAMVTPEARVATAAAAARDAPCPDDPAVPECRPLYIVAEKILGKGERLSTRWAIHGTTGYELLNLAGGLMVDAANARALTAAYVAFTGERTPYADIVYESKKLILEVSMSSELSVLGHALSRLAERSRHSRDFPRKSLTDALREVIACFPLYRTYIEADTREVALQDRACIEVAIAFAKRHNPATSVSLFDFVRDILLLRTPDTADDAYRRDQRSFIQKFQQVTSPVMAKGVEDTAFYRYHRLVSLNEVGSDPEQFGVPVDEFHRQCVARQQVWPDALSATATHDTKRGEDVRARIHVLSEVPRAWRDAVRRWHRWNRHHASLVEGQRAPSRNDEYLVYQTLFGAWPLHELSGEARAEFTARIQAYMAKASKEAKVRTSWISPNEAYDSALERFIGRILDPEVSRGFLADFTSFREPLSGLGMVNGLAQTLLKITAPGVPDFYQGTEFWDLSLVDPDNRRPIDFTARARVLTDLDARMAGSDIADLIRDLVGRWADGRIKLYTIWRALACRRSAPDVFRAGAYLPLATGGRHAEHVCAFARHAGAAIAIAVVPRLTARLTGNGARLPLGSTVWADTHVLLPECLAPGVYVDVFTGAKVKGLSHEMGRALSVAELLSEFPVALLEANE